MADKQTASKPVPSKVEGEPAPAPVASGAAIVPLNKLILSPRNVRKTPPDSADVEALADSIAAKGLLQNLVVSPGEAGRGGQGSRRSTTSAGGIYEVDAGGCRYLALQLLVKRGERPRDWPVPVVVIPREDAAEASLAENAIKIAMNPADEVLGYQAVIESYERAADVDPAEQIAKLARRFGQTERYVRQRLRLAALAPEILQALRERRITVDAAQAYAGHPDHKEQLRVFAAEEKKQECWRHGPVAIRDAINGRVYTADHKAVRFVGLDAYIAAGGRTERDLFFGAEDRELLLDPAIVDRLATEKAAAEAGRLAQIAGFADGAMRPWNGGAWAEPKAPKGYKAAYSEPPAEARPEAVAAFEIAEDGSGLRAIQRWFVKEAGKPAATYGREPEGQHPARERKRLVEIRAARLAVPPIAGTPLEGRANWPAYDGYVRTFDQSEAGDVVLVMLVTVPAADVAAARERAEWELVEEESQTEQPAPAKAGEAQPAGDEAGAAEACPEPVEAVEAEEAPAETEPVS